MRTRCALGAVVAALAAAAASAAATKATALGSAVRLTAQQSSMRWVIDIAVVKRRYPATVMHVVGARGRDRLLVRVKDLAVVLQDGTQIPGPEQSAMLDGPFLYEGAPNGVAIDGHIRWLRVPVSHGHSPAVLTTMRSLSPVPLFRVLDESPLARTSMRTRKFSGAVDYADPIVRRALTAMTGGIEFRNLRFEADLGRDGLVHTIKLTGRTADGVRSLSIDARLYAFGRPVTLVPPREGTFMDQKSFILAD